MQIPYNRLKPKETVEVSPIVEEKDFAIIPRVSVEDGESVEGQITLVHNRTGFAIFNAPSEEILYLSNVCSLMQSKYPLLGKCPNPASVKRYAERTKEGAAFKEYAKRVNNKLIGGNPYR